MRVLVTGGRHYSDKSRVYSTLDKIHAQTPISCIIEGGATGADRIGRMWALERSVDVLTFPADWKAHGRAAGPIRNQQMIDEGNPDLVVAFPGGAGTANMVGLASGTGVKVYVVGG